MSRNEVVSDVAGRATAHLNAVLSNRGRWSYAENPVVRYFGVRSHIVDRGSIFLVILNHVAYDSGGATSPLHPSAHQDRHAVLTARD